jgi:hypothetical protein
MRRRPQADAGDLDGNPFRSASQVGCKLPAGCRRRRPRQPEMAPLMAAPVRTREQLAAQDQQVLAIAATVAALLAVALATAGSDRVGQHRAHAAADRAAGVQSDRHRQAAVR